MQRWVFSDDHAAGRWGAGPVAVEVGWMSKWLVRAVVGFAWVLAGVSGAWGQTQGRPVYRCPGPPVLYTDDISPAEAQKRGCRTIENAPVTVIQSTVPRAPARAATGAAAERPAESRVNADEQRRRDSDARRILQAELKREEENLAALQKEYNNGEPERLGSERNYQRYLDRVAEMKAGIERKEADIAAIKRELAKLPQ
jgi:hypothetical protein